MEELRLPLKRALITACAAVVVAGGTAAKAELALNFTPINVTGYQGTDKEQTLLDCHFTSNVASNDCNRGGDTSWDPDPTPFLQETVKDGNAYYYHVMLGDPDSDFSQEYYILAGGGKWLDYREYPLSASEGEFNGGVGATPSGPEVLYSGLTFVNPLSNSVRSLNPNVITGSGNGSGDPESMIFRQTIDQGTTFSQEILKANYKKKPIIKQTITDDELYSYFEVDLSMLGYTDAYLTQTGNMTNIMTVIDKDSGVKYVDFNGTDVMAQDAQIITTHGAYRYHSPLIDSPEVPGYESRDPGGLYEYDSGTYDIYEVQWAAYWHGYDQDPYTDLDGDGNPNNDQINIDDDNYQTTRVITPPSL